LKLYNIDLPNGAKLSGDKAHNDYDVEDLTNEAGISFIPIRKKNSQRTVPSWVNYLRSSYFKLIGTTGSLMERLFPKHIDSVTAKVLRSKLLSLFWPVRLNTFLDSNLS
jgi:hypothetical protein